MHPKNIAGPWLLSLPSGAGQSFNRADEFIAALSKALTEATDIEQLFAIWERNVDTVRAINKHTNRSTPRGVIAQNLVAHLKSRAIALAKQGEPSIRDGTSDPEWLPPQGRQERPRYSRAEANSLKGAPALCRQPALPDLRSHPGPCASYSLCTTERASAQSE